LVQYISQYAHDFSQASQIACHLDLPTEVPPITLTAEVRHNLFMVVKEALNNILKHSLASEARLRLTLQDGVLEIRMQDNGRGFDVASAAISQRSGLANMQHRTEMLGALLHIESQPAKGTSVSVRMTYSPKK
jgi:signal transduction histidine kinase